MRSQFLFVCFLGVISALIQLWEQQYFFLLPNQNESKKELDSLYLNYYTILAKQLDSSTCIKWNKLFYSQLLKAGFSKHDAQVISNIQKTYSPNRPEALLFLLDNDTLNCIPLNYYQHLIDWETQPPFLANKKKKKVKPECQLPHYLVERILAYGKKLNGFKSSIQLNEVYGYTDWVKKYCNPTILQLPEVIPQPIDTLIANYHPYYKGICAGLSNYCDSIFPFRTAYRIIE